MADYLPKFTPGAPFTLTASADITGGRLVAVSGDRTVATAGADSAAAIGVAGFDVLNGESVTVYPLVGVQRLVLAGTVAAGARLAAAASGKVDDTGTYFIGIALQGGAADDVIDVLTSDIFVAEEA